MAAPRQTRYSYQAGGSLSADAPSYIVRQADSDLLTALLSGTYCYVLTARQMGKSSLRVRTVEQLFEAGVLCAEVELLGIGSQQITASQWYGGIIQVLIASLGLRINRRKWLAEHDDLSPVQRLGTFVEDVVLPKTEQPLVFFFDEIDSVLGLHFPTDEFFGLVRSWYEKRAINKDYNRLTIVMLGVATPSDLMQGTHSTPFNIGKAIELQGFSFEEARPLAQGLNLVETSPEEALKEILTWTGGQPFLTQKLCRLVSQDGLSEHSISSLVKARVIDNWEAQDEPEHLRTVRNRVLRNAQSPQQLLKLYRHILKQGSIPPDNSHIHTELRLTGLVIRQQGQLKVFNQIYSTVFDRAWVDAQLQRVSTRRAEQSLSLPWWAAMATGVGSALLVILLRSLGLLQPFELFAFDQFMQSRPAEPADDRFLIVTVSEADIQYQDRLGMERTGSLSDEALLKTWEKIAPYAPSIIGLDLYHPFPFSPALSESLTSNDRFVGVCEIGQTLDDSDFVSIPPPPALREHQIGFTDFALDADYRVRRHLLGMPGTNTCNTSAAFSWQLALRYLSSAGYELTESPDGRILRIGDVTLTLLTPTAGGYRLRADEVGSHEILANYRNQSPRQIGLQTLLEGQLDSELAELVRDRIILIGPADLKDSHFTSVQSNHPLTGERMLGVSVHAHLASQLISAVIDGRPLLWWLPDWGEHLWIVGWAIVGSSAVWIQQASFKKNQTVAIVLLGGGTLFLCGTTYAVFLVGGWLPLVPSLLAAGLSSGATLLVFTFNPKETSV